METHATRHLCIVKGTWKQWNSMKLCCFLVGLSQHGLAPAFGCLPDHSHGCRLHAVFAKDSFTKNCLLQMKEFRSTAIGCVYNIYIMHVCIYTHWFLFAYLSMCIFNMRVGSCRNSLTCRSCLRDAPVCCRFASDPFASDLTQWTGIPFKLCLSSRWSVSSLGPSLRTSVANPPLTAAGEPDVPASWPQIQRWTSNWFLLIADLGWFGAEFRFQCFLELEVHYGSWLFPSHS